MRPGDFFERRLTLWALGSPGTSVAVVGGDSSRLWVEFGVSASPTVVVFEGGRMVRRLAGRPPEDVCQRFGRPR
jgi:hypothetical protein